MSIYGGSFLSIQESAPVVELEETVLTQEEALDLQQSMIEAMMDLDSFEEETEMLEEGANIEYHDAFKAGKKKYKDAAKEAKKAMKAKDYAAAKAATKKMKSACDDIEKVLKSVESTAGSAVFGYFASGLVIMGEMLIPVSLHAGGATMAGLSAASAIAKGPSAAAAVGAIAGGATATVGYVTTVVKSIIIFVKDLIQFIDGFKNGDKAADALNLYRNKLLRFVKDMRGTVDKIDSLVDKRKAADK